MNQFTSREKKTWAWNAPRFPKMFFGILICADIAASILIPEHDSIRFAGKYLLFVLAILLPLKRASTSKVSISSRWRMVANYFIFWTLGFSAVYLSQTLYKETRPVFQQMHDISFFAKMIVAMWTVLIPFARSESRSDRYCRISSLCILAFVYMSELKFSAQYSVSARPTDTNLFGLTFFDYSSLLLVTTFSVRLYSTHDRNARIFYGSILACLIAEGIGLGLAYNTSIITFPKILLDIWIAYMPMLAFLIVAGFDLDIAPWLEIPPNDIIEEAIDSSLSLITPIITGIMGLLLWGSQPHFVIALVIGVICIIAYAVQSFIRHVNSYEQLRAARDEKKILKGVLHQDPVTGIYNRRWFDEALLLGCEDAKEGKPSIVIFMIDVDSFKGYNDTLGHRAGDYCLKAVAGALRSALGRERDAVARYGGDEMAAILFQTNAEGAMAVAERMRQAVWELNINHPKNSHQRATVSIGIGIAGVTPGLIMPSDLVLAADAALYESKARGKNTVTLRETVPAVDTAMAMVIDKRLSVAPTVMASSLRDS